jgi:hypothetical protein
MRHPIPAQRDRRPLERSDGYKGLSPLTTGPHVGPARDAVETRIAELRRRYEAGEPVLRDGENFSPGYGAHRAGTLADELPCDVIDNSGRENHPSLPSDDDEGEDDE